MSKPRVHVEARRWGERIGLQEAERRHLVDVLRLGPGAEVEIFDGAGSSCRATLVREARGWWLQIGERETRTPRGPAVHLAVAWLKKPKLDLVLRMVTEVGVASITVFGCARSVPRPDPARLEARARRWQTIVAQAARQSGQATVPAVHPPCALDHLLDTVRVPVRLVLHPAEGGDGSLQRALEGRGRDERLVLVGPEGGFDPGELERMQQAGFVPVALELPVLRAETAAVVAVALARLLSTGQAERGADREGFGFDTSGRVE